MAEVDIAVFLLNYGVLGAWTCWLLYEKRSILMDLRRAIYDLRDAINDRNRDR